MSGLTDGQIKRIIKRLVADGAMTEDDLKVEVFGVSMRGLLSLILDSFADVIDEVRAAGDPVGTIRRSDGGTIALRTNSHAESPWDAFSPHGSPIGQWTQDQVSKWPIVYSPPEVS